MIQKKRMVTGLVITAFMVGTFSFAAVPSIDVLKTNHTAIALYERFEITIDLQGGAYTNPYDPAEIDVRAEMISPSGRQWRLFGFYDNYRGVNDWKVRFAPDETGEWTFRLTARNRDGMGESPVYTFQAVPSMHHGWIHVSDDNPHYLEHDDGVQFYGIGAYMPWGNTVSRFDRLAAASGNFFAIWNVNYNGMINMNQLIEEELGRYNQSKCGMIDSMIQISETRGLYIQYCFWPHDLFSETVWAAQWQRNPYRFLCDVDYVYSDPACWEYQKKLYRYLVARFAYSRSWGVWEIMNEMNGTDGWAHGYTMDCYNWVSSVDQWFKENDPYRHPTTASFSGGYTEYRPELYKRCDMPNIHIYETQGWPSQFSNNPLRSSMANYADASLRFWNAFDKPAQFGEAGYTATYYQPGEPEYTHLYHNAVWASLMNGLSITPVWWTLNELSAGELSHFPPLRTFVNTIDLIHVDREPFRVSSSGTDLMGMKSDSTAFGWVRDINAQDVSGQDIVLYNQFSASILNFNMEIYDTWSGTVIDTLAVPQIEQYMIQRIPHLTSPRPDIAFRLWAAENGSVPSRLKLMSFIDEILSVSLDSTDILCAVLDDAGRICPETPVSVTFQVTGPGTILGNAVRQTESGTFSTFFQPVEGSGPVQIIAAAPGLDPDTLHIEVINRFPIDDFETYDTDEAVQSEWTAQYNTIISPSLTADYPVNGSQSLRLDYTIGVDSPPYAFISKIFQPRDLKWVQSIVFQLKPDGTGRELEIRLQTDTRNYMRYRMNLTDTTLKTILIPLDSFTLQSGLTSIDRNRLNEVQFKINRGAGNYGLGTLYIDDIEFRIDASIPASAGYEPKYIPRIFQLFQNYPNPFNPVTSIRYSVPETAKIRLSLHNVVGQEITVLENSVHSPGNYIKSWNAAAFPSGVYFYRLEGGGNTLIKKCLLLK